MQCSLPKFFAPAICFLASSGALAQGPTYHLGRPATAAEIKKLDIAISPEGKELPPGNGAAKEGAQLFAQKCAVCHGSNGEGGIGARLVGGKGTLNTLHPEKTVGSFYASATTVWDYINRAMPQNAPGSLAPDEVYALTAFLLYKNGIIPENLTLNAKSLPKVQMPNRNGFVPPMPVYPDSTDNGYR